MDTEYEAKFYPVNKDNYRKKLHEIGAKLVIPERKMRRVLADRRANPQIKCDYIRVRDEGTVVRLSAKIHAREGGSISDQKEAEVEVANYEETIEVLKHAGLVFNLHEESLREEWEYNGAQITIDTWPGLETYSEIEASSEIKVKETADKLELDWQRKIVTAVVEIFCRVYSLSEEDVLNKLSNITFENNPFEGLKRVWTPENHV